MKIFADDTKIYYPIQSLETPQLLRNDVGKSETWTHIWKMMYNNKKCLSSFKSVCLLVQKKKVKIDFQDGCFGGHFGFKY